MASFVQRIIGSAKLQSATYEDVENDRGATGQAMLLLEEEPAWSWPPG